MINDQQPSDELDKYLAWLISQNSIDVDPHGYFGQWTREQWESALEVRNAITFADRAVSGTGDYLHPTTHVPEWLRDILNATWFRHPGSDPTPHWLTSIDHRINWFALADDHPQLVLENPYTELITPTMMREAVDLARTRGAQVVIHADLGAGRDSGTVTCGLNAIYLADDATTLVIDIADIFGGIVPNPTTGSGCIPAVNTAINYDTVYYAWEWSGMSWPDLSDDSSAGFSV